MATGSEVHLIVAAEGLLARRGIKARLVSMPCWQLFDEQSAAYRDEVLPPRLEARLAVEAGIIPRVAPVDRFARRSRHARSLRRLRTRAEAHDRVRLHARARRRAGREARVVTAREPAANPLLELQRLGQSPWHDNIHRGLLRSGALARMVRDGDIVGLTSNPTIFEQAIAQSADYDDALATLAAGGRTPEADRRRARSSRTSRPPPTSSAGLPAHARDGRLREHRDRADPRARHRGQPARGAPAVARGQSPERRW